MRTSCPECNHPVAKDVYACPNCPASWEHESEDGYRAKPRRDVPFFAGPLAWILILAGAVFIGWVSIVRVMELADPDNASSPINEFVQKRTDRLDPRVAAAARGERSDGSSRQAPAKDEFADARDSPDWKVHGGIFDLVTLAPVSGATVTFEDPVGGRRAQTRTDSRGRYATRLEPLDRGGYLVRIAKPGYARNYFLPGEQGISYMTPDERKALAVDVAAGDEEPGTVQPYSADPVTTDFYLAPSGAK